MACLPVAVAAQITCALVEAIRYDSPDPVLVLPFTCRGGTGAVDVHYGVTVDPVGVGFHLVASGFEEKRFRGFPVIRAGVSFEGDGYLAVFGWLQVVSRRIVASGEVDVVVDLPPMLAGADSPLAGFSYLPTLLDAPANPDHPDGDWTAETFLVAVPDIARTRCLTALTGFRWGYRLVAGKPAPLPVSPIGPDRWKACRPKLEEMYQTWRFLDGTW
jgi:hypothetical protein